MTGRMWAIWPVSSKTITAVDTVCVTAPASAAAPRKSHAQSQGAQSPGDFPFPGVRIALSPSESQTELGPTALPAGGTRASESGWARGLPMQMQSWGPAGAVHTCSMCNALALIPNTT